MEYQRFKDAAYAIGARDWLGRDVFPRGEDNLEESVEKADEIREVQTLSEEVSLIDLLNSFKLVMQRRPRIHHHQVESLMFPLVGILHSFDYHLRQHLVPLWLP